MMVERRKAQRRQADKLLKKTADDIISERQKDDEAFAELLAKRGITAIVICLIFFALIWATGKNAGVI